MALSVGNAGCRFLAFPLNFHTMPPMKQFPVIEETEEVEMAPKKEPMGGGIRIPIPDGFKIPQGKREGDEIEFLVKGRQMGGHLILDKLNGIKLSNAAEEAEEMETDETADETADKESREMAEEDGDEQFASELSNAVRQMR